MADVAGARPNKKSNSPSADAWPVGQQIDRTAREVMTVLSMAISEAAFSR
jgi:hypothetical protein